MPAAGLRLLGMCLNVRTGAARDPGRLRHRLRDPAAQDALIAAANEALVTPALYTALCKTEMLAEIREPLRSFLRSFHEVNRERNEAFATQLAEAARALNAAGIRPLVLKGARALLDSEPRDLGRRVMCDLDLMVPEDSANAASKALAGIGYEKVKSFDGIAHTHEIGDFARPRDPGAVDLHRAITGFPGHHPGRSHCRDLVPAEAVFAAAGVASIDGAEVLVPDPRHQLLHIVLHDQLQGRDHYTARLHVRHLLDVAELLRDMEQSAVCESVEMMRPHHLTSMVISHLLAARALFGGPVPASLRRRPWPRLIHGARMAAVAHPRFAVPQRWLGTVAWEFARCRYPVGVPTWRLLAWRAARLWAVVLRRGPAPLGHLRRAANRF